jgi:adenosylcobinamide amidohydrolase
MRAIIAAALLIVTSSVVQADVALILNDLEQKALLEALDVATKAQGLSIAPNTVYLMNKLKAAGTVTDKKDVQKDNPNETLPK